MHKKIAVLAVLLTLNFVGIAAEDSMRPPPARINSALPSASQVNLAASYRISILDEFGGVVGAATGVAVDKRSIISAGHVVSPGAKYQLDLFNEDGEFSYGIPLIIDRWNDPSLEPNRDLALFHTEQDVPHFTTLRYVKNIRVSDWVYTIGARFGEAPYCIGWGQLASKTSRDFPGLWLAALDSAPGNSGGGVWNSRHEFVGILVRGAPSIVLFVPAQTVYDFIYADR